MGSYLKIAVENALPIFFIFPSSVDVLSLFLFLVSMFAISTVGFSICKNCGATFCILLKPRFSKIEVRTSGIVDGRTFDSGTKVFFIEKFSGERRIKKGKSYYFMFIRV